MRRRKKGKKKSIPLSDWVVVGGEEKKADDVDDMSPKRIKNECRDGLTHSQRQKIWLTVTNSLKPLEEDPELYYRHVEELFPKSRSTSWRDIPQIPNFGSVCDWEPHNLSDADMAVINEMLCVFGHNHPHLKYCPLLVEVIPILLKYMTPPQVYVVINQLLIRSQIDGWYFQLTTVRAAVFSQTFLHILEAKLPKLYKHMENIDVDILEIVNFWFTRIFINYLPFDIVFRICDAYFCEGYKIIYRVALAIFSMFTDSGLECRDAAFFVTTLRNWCNDLETKEELLMDTSFKFLLKRKSFHSIDATHDVSELDVPRAEERVLRWPSFHENQSYVINMQQLYQLWLWLPEQQRTGDLYRLYTSHDDGRSMISFLEKVENRGASIILIKDEEDNVFGAFLRKPVIRSLKPQKDRSLMLFSLHPESEFYVWNQNDLTDVVTYFSTDKLYIGDASAHAIYLPSNMEMGTTTRTKGFNSPPLSPSPTGDFACKELEVWGFKDSIMEDHFY